MSELFRARCVQECLQPRLVGQDNQAGLLRMGVGRCPGPTASPAKYCSLIGEAVESLTERHQQIPSTMVYDAVVGVIQGEITAVDIPDPATAYPDVLLARWGALMCALDEVRFPGQHYNPTELLQGKIPQ